VRSIFPGPTMSRSLRKTPIFGFTTAVSEAFDKATWHRAFRRAENQRLQSASDDESRHFRELSSPWWMQKDGKHWCSEALATKSHMRK
jgi:hypothetical protein